MRGGADLECLYQRKKLRKKAMPKTTPGKKKAVKRVLRVILSPPRYW